MRPRALWGLAGIASRDTSFSERWWERGNFKTDVDSRTGHRNERQFDTKAILEGVTRLSIVFDDVYRGDFEIC